MTILRQKPLVNVLFGKPIHIHNICSHTIDIWGYNSIGMAFSSLGELAECFPKCPTFLKSISGARRTVHLKFGDLSYKSLTKSEDPCRQDLKKNDQKVTPEVMIFVKLVLRAPWTDFNNFWTKIQGFSRTFCFLGSKSENPRQHCQKPVTTQHRNHPKWRKSGSVIGFRSIGVVPVRVMHQGR